MARNFGIALAQIEIVRASNKGETNNNVTKMVDKIEKIADDNPDVDLIAFPEMAITGFNCPKWKELAEPIPGPSLNRLCKAAKENKRWICSGGIAELGKDGNIYNTASLISPNGEIVLNYRKTHPWIPAELATPGKEYPIYDIPGGSGTRSNPEKTGRFGIMICYDGLAFPEPARTLAWKGAEVILWVSVTFHPHTDIWQTMCKAHAMFNQCYIAAVNASGMHGGCSAAGHSQFVDPNGVVMSELGEGEGVLVEILDLDQVTRVRKIGSKHGHMNLKHWKELGHRYEPYMVGIGKGDVFKRKPFV